MFYNWKDMGDTVRDEMKAYLQLLGLLHLCKSRVNQQMSIARPSHISVAGPLHMPIVGLLHVSIAGPSAPMQGRKRDWNKIFRPGIINGCLVVIMHMVQLWSSKNDMLMKNSNMQCIWQNYKGSENKRGYSVQLNYNINRSYRRIKGKWKLYSINSIWQD